MSKKKPRARTERRAAERAAVKDSSLALRLAALAPGGAPDHPLVVTSASVVEPQAASAPCVVCGASVRVGEHRADPTAGLRVVSVRCAACGVARELFFRIAQPN